MIIICPRCKERQAYDGTGYVSCETRAHGPTRMVPVCIDCDARPATINLPVSPCCGPCGRKRRKAGDAMERKADAQRDRF